MSIMFSGFADEIAKEFDTQISVVKALGMDYVCLRGIDDKNISDFSVEEFQSYVMPKLAAASLKVSSMGSPVGKVDVNDEEGFVEHLDKLDRICQMANLIDCKYVRMFSFRIDKDDDADKYEAVVMEKLVKFIEIAKKYNIILLHENEKGIFGDTGKRCKLILDTLVCDNFKAAFDSANFVQCGENALECYEMLKQYVIYFHIKDASNELGYNVVCGTGDGQIPLILKKAIKEDNYSGFMTIEPHLAEFGSLNAIELEGEASVINPDNKSTNAQCYELQYNSLLEILKNI